MVSPSCSAQFSYITVFQFYCRFIAVTSMVFDRMRCLCAITKSVTILAEIEAKREDKEKCNSNNATVLPSTHDWGRYSWFGWRTKAKTRNNFFFLYLLFYIQRLSIVQRYFYSFSFSFLLQLTFDNVRRYFHCNRHRPLHVSLRYNFVRSVWRIGSTEFLLYFFLFLDRRNFNESKSFGLVLLRFHFVCVSNTKKKHILIVFACVVY